MKGKFSLVGHPVCWFHQSPIVSYLFHSPSSRIMHLKNRFYAGRDDDGIASPLWAITLLFMPLRTHWKKTTMVMGDFKGFSWELESS
jgi:hypothetical protein